MAAAAPGTPERARARAARERASGATHDRTQGVQQGVAKARPIVTFWTKLNNDWVFNFAGTLAYGFLTSVVPILLVIIGIGGFLLGTISPDGQARLESSIANALPGGASGNGGKIVHAALSSFHAGAGPLLILGVVTLLIAGSSLFVTMENIFGVIFRLRGRSPLQQRIMAIGMLLIFAVLVPLIVLVAAVLPAIVSALGIGTSNPVAGFFFQALSLVGAFVFAALLFAAIYIVVPNKPVKAHEVWKGTLVAAALLVLYEALFPIYEGHFLRPGNLGPLVGFVIVIGVFFYYLAFILLLGAEVNSWASGQRETAGPIDAILYDLQAHNTTRDTPSTISHERTAHKGSAQPPKYTESSVTGHGYCLTDAQHPGVLFGTHAAPDEQVAYSETRREATTRPMTPRQRTTAAALAASAAVVLTGVARFLGRLDAGRNERTPAAD
jgi:membrane protein